MSTQTAGAYHKLRTPAATKPTGCPVDHAFTTFTSDYLSNPYPELERLNAEQPVFYSEKLGLLVVTRMADVVEIFREHDVFSSANVQDPIYPVCERATEILSAEDFNPIAVMSNRQEPDHKRIRKFTREVSRGGG